MAIAKVTYARLLCDLVQAAHREKHLVEHLQAGVDLLNSSERSILAVDAWVDRAEELIEKSKAAHAQKE